jgi:hypothetical protein
MGIGRKLIEGRMKNLLYQQPGAPGRVSRRRLPHRLFGRSFLDYSAEIRPARSAFGCGSLNSRSAIHDWQAGHLVDEKILIACLGFDGRLSSSPPREPTQPRRRQSNLLELPIQRHRPPRRAFSLEHIESFRLRRFEIERPAHQAGCIAAGSSVSELFR